MSLPRKRVLVVEDDPDLRIVLEQFLESLNLECLSSIDGQAAIERLKKETFDILITDFRMPRVDGVQLLAWCREQKFHFPVIFLSANANLIDAEQVALGDCCATLMYKPFNLDALEAALDSATRLIHHAHCVHHQAEPT